MHTIPCLLLTYFHFLLFCDFYYFWPLQVKQKPKQSDMKDRLLIILHVSSKLLMLFEGRTRYHQNVYVGRLIGMVFLVIMFEELSHVTSSFLVPWQDELAISTSFTNWTAEIAGVVIRSSAATDMVPFYFTRTKKQ